MCELLSRWLARLYVTVTSSDEAARMGCIRDAWRLLMRPVNSPSTLGKIN